MLTLVAVPKPFEGHYEVIQRNALASWARLGEHVEVILFGDEPGTAEHAREFAFRHLPKLTFHACGAPCAAALFASARHAATQDLIAYVNADLMLLDDFLPAVQAIFQADDDSRPPMMVASRYNLDVTVPVEMEAGWEDAIRARVAREGTIYRGGGSDVFVFARGLLGEVPPLAIGRGYWDNWLMYEARRRGGMLVDATDSVVTVHQNHGYPHAAQQGQDLEYGQEVGILTGPEGRRNLRLAGGWRCVYTVLDADRLLVGGVLVSTYRGRYLLRHLKAWARRQLMAVYGQRRGGFNPIQVVKRSFR